jgi:hypothetical protein
MLLQKYSSTSSSYDNLHSSVNELNNNAKIIDNISSDSVDNMTTSEHPNNIQSEHAIDNHNSNREEDSSSNIDNDANEAVDMSEYCDNLKLRFMSYNIWHTNPPAWFIQKRYETVILLNIYFTMR